MRKKGPLEELNNTLIIKYLCCKKFWQVNIENQLVFRLTDDDKEIIREQMDTIMMSLHPGKEAISGSRAIYGKRFLKSNASLIIGTLT